MKSIKSCITVVILTFVAVLSLIFGSMCCYLNYRTANAVLEQNLSQTAIVAADHVAAEIKSIQNVAIETGCTASLANPDISVEEKKKIIDDRAKNYNFQRGNLLNEEGISIFDGNDYSERDYFKASINGNAYISNPTISKITGKTTFLISAPLWKDGVPNTTVIGVIYYAPDENFLNNIVANINVSQSGYALLLNKDGTTVADKDSSLVGVDNHITEAKTDKSLEKLAAVHTRMIAGESGVDKFAHEGDDWVQGFAPVPNTNGWSIGILAMEKDFLGNFYLSIWITCAVIIIFLLVGTVTAFWVGNRIGTPIKLCVKRLEMLAQGDLSTEVPKVISKDETGILAEATATLTNYLNTVVGEVSDSLAKMSDGNFSIPNLRAYEGDFNPLSEAINHIITSLNDALSQIHVVSGQVSTGSGQVSSGAQSLSQGATEQASAIEELSASIIEISEHVRKNADNANKANALSHGAAQKLLHGNDEMEKMLIAMEEITESSNKIGYIIKTINDIAFQTNILALNAAVEAARAGVAGKGFAVVADEVRNLASKSADAAKETTELIENSVRVVGNGTQLADNTAKILLEVMAEAKQSTELVGQIAEVSSDQAQSIDQVTRGVEQISSVVQTNSATAEDSAAASEELNGQAQMLKELVGRFRLKDERHME